MKVLIWKAADNDRDASTYIYKEAKRQGLDVHIAGTRNNFEPVHHVARELNPDIVFIYGIDLKNTNNYKTLRERGCKLVLSYHDQASVERDKLFKSATGLFDLAIFSTIQGCELYGNVAKASVWVPQSFDYIMSKPIKRLDESKEIYDICFLSYCPDKLRNWFLNGLRKDYKVFVGNNHRLGEMAKIYAQSKIAINIRRGSGFNDDGDFLTSNRIFNAMGCGAFYLTHTVRKLEIFFKEGVHLVTHDSTYKDVESKIKYYLNSPVERERIALAGQTEILLNHTLEVRVKQYWHEMEKIL